MTKLERTKEGLLEGIDFITDPLGISPFGTNLSGRPLLKTMNELVASAKGDEEYNKVTEARIRNITLDYASAKTGGLLRLKDVPMENGSDILRADVFASREARESAAKSIVARERGWSPGSDMTGETLIFYKELLEAMRSIDSKTMDGRTINTPATVSPGGPVPPGSN
jgi:hypothetical protein